jgi:fimbrial chaperone protein
MTLLLRIVMIGLCQFCLAWHSSAWAITASPLSASLDLSEKRSHIINVTNSDLQKTVPVNVQVFSWDLQPNGEEILSPSNDLLIFPKQMILKPGQRRVIRVAPREKVVLSQEKTYRIKIEELPINVNGEKNANSGVSVLLAYMTAFYLSPAQATSDVIIKDIELKKGTWLFDLFNQGNAHTHLKKLNIQLLQENKTVLIDEATALPNFDGENIFSQRLRRFSWTVPDQVKSNINTLKPFQVKLIFNCEFCASPPVSLPFTVN